MIISINNNTINLGERVNVKPKEPSLGEKVWSQIKDFVQTHKKEIFVAMLISGIALLSMSLGAVIGSSLIGSLQASTGWGTVMTTSGWVTIGGLISSIFGAAMTSFGAGGLMAGGKK